MGPSHIKKAEEQGFGLGIFTGKPIAKGTPLEPLYNHGPVGEPLIPLYGHDTLYMDEPPLREYVWDEAVMPEVAVEYPIALTALFIPGLAAMAPCTSLNYNMELLGGGSEDGIRYSVKSNYTSSHLGAHAVRHNVTFVATRDIAAGEELTIQCTDDNFDGGAYFLQTFDDTDDAVMCLDQLVQVAPSPKIQGHGLFAQQTLPKDTKLLTTPMLPIHRDDLVVSDHEKHPRHGVNNQQLLLNYCYGSPDSDLLWLPFGPMINFLNHDSNPNARVQWYSAPPATHKSGATNPHVRQQHHHTELFDLPAETVADIHGKSLTLEVIALRTIQPGEEVTIDYGTAWQTAFEKHQKMEHTRKMVEPHNYEGNDNISAEEWNDQNHPYFSTLVEQLTDPVPDKLEIFVFYEVHDHDDHHHRTHKHAHVWDEDQVHECFRPCQILERVAADDENGTPTYTYTVQLMASDDSRIMDECVLDDHDEILKNVPQRAIRMMDRPFTTPQLDPQSFRHEIGLPDVMIPDAWRKKKLRSRSNSETLAALTALVTHGEQFKRKTTVEIKAKGSSTGSI